MLLGRRLLQTTSTASTADKDETLQTLSAHDRFFCDTMENIPAAFYFPTDAEANWKKSAPKKYHKNVQALKTQESSKKGLLKRAKFSPAAQQSNEERQMATAEAEKQEKRQVQGQGQVKPVKASVAKDEGGLDGLRARLAVKIQAMREQRKAEEKTGKKRPSRAEAAAEQRALKKRKTAVNKSKAKAEKREKEAAAKEEAQKQSVAMSETVVDAASISYGSLLLADDADSKDNKPKTRNGQGVRGIQNLLKKAERNVQRLEELKKTEEGAEKAKQKGWDTALQQAAGQAVLDDPKLLRAKLKKKEKAKAKSTKEWKERTSKLEVSKKERQKKKLANSLGRNNKDKDAKEAAPREKKGRKGPRAGFEGKKGEGFLNADKKGGKPAAKKSAGPSK
ncbi:hypothetical protein BBJ29_004107 [Phytophthora kernoviae]|uniref:Ribosomal RNA-processing protein 14/surfeit locus protein 6 C-terminal domain-containing protein n=1 Tax=Phytophthora kernoviae TaxID=325452 RepID=A0A3F2RNP0_9STRA|nr:hypothetical protein BBJ29_004107 [Phytophthora kernoviae]RLN61223.1 hypothetical protein BBP00_00005526 [Phytophthora kernoviae]